MVKNYLKIAFRNLWKHRAYAFINVSGLAIGMACCILIVLYIQDELRYDQHHENADEIYRVWMDLKRPGAEFELASTMAPLGPALVADVPEVIQATRVSMGGERLVARGEKQFYEEAFYFADSTIFDVFTYPLLRGDPQTALQDPFSVVLTEKAARKYFGEEDPMGQVLTLGNEVDFEITGILAPLPSYTHFKFDFLASFASRAEMNVDGLESWDNISDAHTYVVIPEGPTINTVEEKLNSLFASHVDDRSAEAKTLHLQPLKRIHLYSDFSNENGEIGDITNLYVFASIALLILLIASINFINLSTARSARRAREVGMRKVLGAFRFQLIKQFIGESILLAGLSMVLAIALVEILMPLFNYLLAKDLAVDYRENGTLLVALGGITFFVGVIAGSYPAFLLSAFRPVDVLKRQVRQGGASMVLRKGLVIMQFSITIMLIVGSIIMAAQMTYFAEKDLGFNPEQVVVLQVRDPALQQSYETFKRTLLQHPGMVQAAAVSSTPGSNSYDFTTYRPEAATADESVGLRTVFIDHDLVDALGLKLAAGRNFSRATPTDTSDALLINEAAARFLGWEDPLGKTLTPGGGTMKVIIGVVNDFHFSSLQAEIQPIVFRFASDSFLRLVVRINAQDIASTLAFLEEKWREFAPAYPFEYTFLDEDFARRYQKTQRLSETIGSFALLAIFVACLGLFGLVSYTTEQRTKEIGVRKVLGASVPGILLLLSKDFLQLVAVAFVVAMPLAYVAMQRWLEDFAYRVDISWETFLLTGSLTLALALLTVCYQSIKAALTNPVESLRYE